MTTIFQITKDMMKEEIQQLKVVKAPQFNKRMMMFKVEALIKNILFSLILYLENER